MQFRRLERAAARARPTPCIGYKSAAGMFRMLPQGGWSGRLLNVNLCRLGAVTSLLRVLTMQTQGRIDDRQCENA